MPERAGEQRNEATGKGEPASATLFTGNLALAHDLSRLRQRVVAEFSAAVGMLETSLGALFELDAERAREVMSRDDRIDTEEVAIEAECFRLMTLKQPVARDFRVLAFVLKVNNDIERIGDHASSICKITRQLAGEHVPEWPTSLVELGQRVPMACHALLRVLSTEEVRAAKEIIVGDKSIDRITRGVFDETVGMMKSYPDIPQVGLLIYRVGRELERVGDLMTNIAEDIVYLATGEVIRHSKKRLRMELERKGASSQE